MISHEAASIRDHRMMTVQDASAREQRAVEGGAVIARLLLLARKALIEQVDKAFAVYDVTAAQYLVMSRLAHRRAATAVALCREVDCDSGAMTRMLRRLEGKGLLVRMRREDDRRSADVELTEKGMQLLPLLREISAKVLQRLLDGVMPEDQHRLEVLLDRMLANA